MKIALFFEHRDIGASGSYVERALRALGHTVTHFRKSNVADARGQDLYFRMEDGEFGYRFSREQHPVIYWTMDTHLDYPRKKVLEEAPQYDFIFACHQSGEKLLRKRGHRVKWLPVACEPEVHGRVNVPPAYTVASIGKEEGIPRKFFLQEVRERYNPTFIKKAHFSQMQSVYSASKIGFNQAINRDINMRVYEVMCAGAMLLTSEVEDDSYEKLGFIDRKHLVIFHSPKELFELLDYYLSHDSEREAIAEAGCRLAHEKHTYRHRMQTLLSKLKAEGIVRDNSPSHICS
ncbi:MAG: glycosyltransferase family 1 protein [Candidatus Omnitrophica bacterium]|nr:glycosyltransferase family 1 protein [Candidatus Omnitrophota bacterium]